MLSFRKDCGFRWRGDNYLLVDWFTWRSSPRQPEFEAVRRIDASSVLDSAAFDSLCQRQLESFWRAVKSDHFGAGDPRNMVRDLVAMIDDRVGPLLLLKEKRRAFTLTPQASAPAESSPPPEEEALTWIEITIVDEAGNPLSALNTKITKPDGGVTFARTSKEGVVFLHALPPGQCQFELVDFGAASPRGGA